MWRTRLALITGTALAAFSLAIPSASAASPGFAGTWSATDGDGSNLTLSIRGAGPHYAVTELDDAATVCGGAPARVTGAGLVDEGTLYVPVAVVCKPGGNVLRERVLITFTYDSESDTLTDDAGVVWTRTP